MKHKHVLLASLLAASGFAAQSAYAVSTWVGTADYTQSLNPIANADVVGPFDTYDQGVGVVLLKTTSVVGTTANLDGYYQSYITQHTLAGSPVLAPTLDANYELTVVANFTESTNTSTGAINVNSGGTFGLYLGNVKDRSFAGDSGFNNGDLILSGTITGGTGTSINLGSMIFGVTNIDIAVTGYDTNVYSPDTIAAGGGIFTLRLGSAFDAPLLSQVTSVQGNSVAGAGNYLFAADGYTALAVPEAETYAMMLAGLGLVGFMAKRRKQVEA
jgi:hypothetical protein